MLAEAFNALRDFFKPGITQVPTRLKDLEVHPRERMYWNPETKEIGIVEADPPPRSQTVRDLPSLVALIAYAKANAPTYGATLSPILAGMEISDAGAVEKVEFKDPTAAVWIGGDAIRVVFDDTGKRDHQAVLPFVRTPIWSAIEQLRKQPSLSQKDAIRLLRTTFQEFDVGSNALSAAKNIRLNVGTTSESVVTHVSNRMSQAVQREAAGGESLPETLNVLAVPYMGLVWPDESGVRDTFPGYPIEIFLEVDFEEGGFRFEPNDQHVHDALEREALRLQELLTGQLAAVECAHVPVFIGTSGDGR